MDIHRLVGEAKKLINERGGMQSAKEDATELKDIARDNGSTADKAKAAGEALKDPGAPGDPTSPPSQTPPTP